MTVFGHCIHLKPREIEAIAVAQANVAHCPTSNLFLGSGLMKLDQLMKAGIAVGLGSDVAAGPELNMWQVMRAAIDVQKARACLRSQSAAAAAGRSLVSGDRWRGQMR